MSARRTYKEATLRLTRSRRFLLAAGAALTVLAPLGVAGSSPAAAQCGPQLADTEGGSGCTNACNDGAGLAMQKVAAKLGQEWNCTQ